MGGLANRRRSSMRSFASAWPSSADGRLAGTLLSDDPHRVVIKPDFAGMSRHLALETVGEERKEGLGVAVLQRLGDPGEPHAAQDQAMMLDLPEVLALVLAEREVGICIRDSPLRRAPEAGPNCPGLPGLVTRSPRLLPCACLSRSSERPPTPGDPGSSPSGPGRTPRRLTTARPESRRRVTPASQMTSSTFSPPLSPTDRADEIQVGIKAHPTGRHPRGRTRESPWRKLDGL